MSSSILITLLALTISVLPVPAHAFAKHSPHNPLRIMPYGDSLTEGGYSLNQQWHSEGGYRIVLQQLLTDAGYSTHFVGSLANGDFSEAHHEGHAGWRIDQVDALSREWVSLADPDYILLMIGTNDCNQDYNTATQVTRLEQLIEHLQQFAPKAQLLVANLFYTAWADPNRCIDQYNAGLVPLIQAKAAKDARVHFVDFSSVIGNGLNGATEDLIDGVHPSPLGYAKMGNAWFKSLRDVLPTLSK